jgi:quinol monooxygenase YgiN
LAAVEGPRIAAEQTLVFVSHFRIREGARAELERLFGEVSEQLWREKPATLQFAAYSDVQSGIVTFVHTFADAAALDAHFEGSDERSAAVAAYLQPLGWEFYGTPSEAALESIRQAAAATGASLTVKSTYLGGFLRLAAD